MSNNEINKALSSAAKYTEPQKKRYKVVYSIVL